MTVVNPKSISGINSITMASGSDDLLTIHSNNTTERVRVDSSGNLTATGNLSIEGNTTLGNATSDTITVTGRVNSDLSPSGSTRDLGTTDYEWRNLYTTDGVIASDDIAVHASDTNTKIRFPAADTITAETGGSERVRINSSGKILVGDDTAENTMGLNANIQTFGTDASASGFAIKRGSNDAQAAFLVLSKSRNTSVGSRTILNNGDEVGNIFFVADDGTDLASNTAAIKSGIDAAPGANDTPGNLSFWTTASSSNSATQRMKIASDGNVTISDGDLIMGTSGHGISFAATADSASGMTSELLDDYEEGTWTPGLAFGATDTGITYSSRSGSYVKIGRFVYCQGQLDLSSKGSSTGDATFTGLPFTVGDYLTGTSQEGSGFITWWANMASGAIPSTFWISQGGTSATIYRALENSQGAIQTQTNSYWNNNSQVRFTLQYMAA